MKTFSKDFFQIKNFIKERIDFNYSSTDEGAYHIAYNVNDGFIHIMGVSVVSVLENNKDKNFVVHIFVGRLQSGKFGKNRRNGQTVAIVIVIVYLSRHDAV